MPFGLVKVRGHSMAPVYQDGDYVLTSRYRLRKPRAGDDVVFTHPDYGRILKRITQVEPNHFSVAGLNSLSTSASDIGLISQRNDLEIRHVLAKLCWRRSS